MSTNCLVTKLKAVVDNDNLEILGGIVITITGDSAAKMVIKSSVEQDIVALDGHITVSGINVNKQTVAANTETTIYADNITEVKYLITNKYAIESLSAPQVNSILSFDIDALKYSDLLTSCNLAIGDVSNLYGSTKGLSNKAHIENIVIRCAKNIIGDLNDFSENVNLVSLNIARSNFSGELSSLSKLTSLSTIVISECFGVSGSLESLVVGQINNGRRSGDIFMPYLYYTSVTFNGGKATGQGNEHLEWYPNSTDPTKTDVSYDGVTITIDANGNKVE